MMRPTTTGPHAAGRLGATLTEVLMGLLIMSIGVVSVFSLFPISVLRSVRSTQSTNAKISYENALSVIKGNPAVISGAPHWRPQTTYAVGDVVSAVPQRGRTTTSDGTLYMCVGPGLSGTYEPQWPNVLAGIDPGGAGVPPNSRPSAADGGVVWIIAADPNPGNGTAWPGGETVFVSAGTSFVPATPVYGNTSNGRPLTATGVIAVDPLGWLRFEEGRQLAVGAGDAVTAALQTQLRDSFGTAPRLDGGFRGFVTQPARNLGPLGAPDATVTAAWGNLATGTVGSPQHLRRVAAEEFSRRDAYSTFVDAFIPAAAAYGAGTGTFTLPLGFEVTELLTQATSLASAGEAESVRVILSSAGGRSIRRWIGPANITDEPIGTPDTINVGNLTDDGAGNVVQLGGDPVTEIQIQILDTNYSWLATFRQENESVVGGDVVVFFRRSVLPEFDGGYNAQFGNDPADVADNVVVDATLTPNGAYDAVVAAESRTKAWIAPGVDRGDGAGGAADGDLGDPEDSIIEIAVGWWLFDSSSGHWYETIGILQDGDPASGTPWIVELDRPVEEVPLLPVEISGGLTLSPAETAVKAVVPRGIVDVYPLTVNSEARR